MAKPCTGCSEIGESPHALQQLQMEKVHLLEVNRQYLSALAQCEGKMVDFRLLLKLRDCEIALLRAMLGPEGKTKALRIAAQLQTHVAVLKAENRNLRQASDLIAEISLLERKTEGKWERSVTGELEKLSALLQKTAHERDLLQSETVPRLEQTVKLLELERSALERRLDSIRAKGVDKGTSTQESSLLPPADPSAPGQESTPAEHSQRKAQGRTYLPSFRRQKRPSRPKLSCLSRPLVETM